MNLDQLFPSNRLKAADLSTGDVTARISHIEMETFDDGPKPVLHFHNTEKNLVLNKTNASVIASIHGPETDTWAGKQITLGMDHTFFQGKQTPCVRVRPQLIEQATPAAQAAPQGGQTFGATQTPAQPTQQAQPAPAGATAGQDFEDEVPF